MQVKINCIYNNNGAWCWNKKVKRSFFGIGARCCKEYFGGRCPYIKKHIKPDIKPSPRPMR